jgi:sec-independent protein translocase protein TatC
MPSALGRPVAHDEHLSLTEHLEELRSRLMVCIAALIVCFGFTFWQNDAVLSIVNGPLERASPVAQGDDGTGPLEQSARFQNELGAALRATGPALAGAAEALRGLAAQEGVDPAARADVARQVTALEAAVERLDAAARAVPEDVDRRPVTLGVAEPFTTTISVAFYAALLLALPLLLYQAYAFVLPAFSPSERRTALPLMLMVPVLFVAGVAFAYFVVLPRAIGFLQNFNSDSFDILLQARDFYRFAIMFVAVIGLLFQIPIGVLAVTRLGVVSVEQLRANRGYVILGIAVLAAVATPTPDPITMTLAMGPLVLLFEASILLAAWLNRKRPPGSRWDDDEVDDLLDPHDDEDF